MDLSDLYRDIVETSPDGIWVIDLDGRTLYANPAIARLHRIPDEELASLTVFDTLDEGGRAQFAAHLDDVREGRIHDQPRSRCSGCATTATIAWMLVPRDRAARRRGQPAGAAAPLHRLHRAARR